MMIRPVKASVRHPEAWRRCGQCTVKVYLCSVEAISDGHEDRLLLLQRAQERVAHVQTRLGRSVFIFLNLGFQFEIGEGLLQRQKTPALGLVEGQNRAATPVIGLNPNLNAAADAAQLAVFKTPELWTVPYCPNESPLARFNQVTSFLGAWKGHRPSVRIMHNTATHNAIHNTPRIWSFIRAGCGYGQGSFSDRMLDFDRVRSRLVANPRAATNASPKMAWKQPTHSEAFLYPPPSRRTQREGCSAGR